MEVTDPNVPTDDMSKHFAAASSAVTELLETTPPDPNDPDQRTPREGATPDAPAPDKAPEAAPPPTEPTLPTAPPPTNDDEAFKKELEAASQLPKNAHPNAAKAINTMKAVAERERSARAESDRKANEALATAERLSKEAMTPEIKAELEELKKLRRSVDIKSDPEFKEKYTSKLDAGNTRAAQILTRHGLDKAVIDDINKLGGLASAARSNARVPESLDEEQPTWSDWLEKTLLPKTPSIDRRRLEDIISQNANIEDEMQAEMDAVAGDPQSFEEKITKRNQESLAAGINEAKQALGRLAERWEVPAGATAEQKALIEKHNTRFDKVAATVEQVASSIIGNPKMQGRAALLMGQGIYLSEVNAELMTTAEQQTARIGELTKELEAIKKSGSITPSLNVMPQSQDGEHTVKTLPDAKSAIDAMLQNLDN